jgi:hypothetical protein
MKLVKNLFERRVSVGAIAFFSLTYLLQPLSKLKSGLKAELPKLGIREQKAKEGAEEASEGEGEREGEGVVEGDGVVGIPKVIISVCEPMFKTPFAAANDPLAG